MKIGAPIWVSLFSLLVETTARAQLQHLSRTFALLTSSTPTHRNTVHVLFYGQSITAQPWSTTVGEIIQTNYPSANVIIQNLAILGNNVDYLILNAEEDVYPIQPDLIIFYAYGSEENYERFLERLRLRTTADLVIQSDHVSMNGGQPATIIPPPDLQPSDDDWHSEVYLPHAAERWDACWANVRTIWEEYLATNNVNYTNLTVDGVHLNADGNALMEAIVTNYFQPSPGMSLPDPFNCPGVQTFRVPQELAWTNGVLTASFQGSRIDVIAGNGDCSGITAQVDGLAPSQFSGAWAFTRTSPLPVLYGQPCIGWVGSAALLTNEHWTLTVTQTNADGSFLFHVKGSVTGDDGDGTNTVNFQSASGRVVIEPGINWRLTQPAIGFIVSWDAIPLHADEFNVAPPDDPSLESTVTVIQGIPDGPHVLKLVASEANQPAIQAIRVYSPQDRWNACVHLPQLSMVLGTNQSPQVEWPAWLPAWQFEGSQENLGAGAAWQSVLASPAVNAQTNLLDARNLSPQQFFRLRLE